MGMSKMDNLKCWPLNANATGGDKGFVERKTAIDARGGDTMQAPKQAQIAGGSTAWSGELPRKGQLLRDFELNSLRGPVVRLADYRGRSALILILRDERIETERLMRDMAARCDDLRNKGSEVLAIIHSPSAKAVSFERRLNLPYPVLQDADGRLHHELGAMDDQNRDAAALYVADPFGEIVAIFRTAVGDKLPGIGEIEQLLEFISFQCPECEPPEWPV